MRHQDIDVVLEGIDDSIVSIELQCVWWERRGAAGDVVAVPSKEGEFTAVVIVLLLLVSFSFSVHYRVPSYMSEMRRDRDLQSYQPTAQ